MALQIGIDTGGTFTDFVFLRDGTLEIYKRLSTPEKPARAVTEGLREAGFHPLRRVDKMVIGTTVATNAFLERKGGDILLLVTLGLEGIPIIGRQNREELYDLHYRRPPSVIRGENIIGVRERIGSNGEIIQELTEEEIERIINAVEEKKPQAVAISLLFSFKNPIHERILGEELRKRGYFVTLSSEIYPEYREFERTSVTMINSYLYPVVEKYVSEIEGKLEQPFLVMGSSGGSFPPSHALKYPVKMILSGPAGGVAAVKIIGELVGVRNLLSFDMGGTSTDVSLITDDIKMVRKTRIDGYPIPIPMIYLDTVGAGGGSIAWMDEGGALKVGPESAGADPGPICYNRGGDKLTITDANLYLGRISPDFFLGGKMKLNVEKMEEAFDYYSKKWNIPPVELAEGIIEVANNNMARVLRRTVTGMGYNPADFHLVPFGGAGGLHLCQLADLLDIDRFISPRYGGVLSALGVVWSDIVFEATRSVLTRANSMEETLLENYFEDMEREILIESKKEPIFLRSMLMRYEGQSYELEIDYRPGMEELKREFERRHKALYGFLMKDREIEIVSLQVKGIIRTGEKTLPTLPLDPDSISEAYMGVNEGYFMGERVKFRMYNRELLKAGVRIEGPAIFFENTSTLLLAPGWRGETDRYGNIIGYRI